MVGEFSEKQKGFIASQRVLRFNSLTEDGRIHSVPLCFAFDGRNFYVHCANTGAKRWQNLRKNNVVSVELDYYVDDWSGNKGVLVYGKSTFLEPGGEGHSKGMSLLKGRYTQYREKFKVNDAVGLVKVEPSKIISWFL